MKGSHFAMPVHPWEFVLEAGRTLEKFCLLHKLLPTVGCFTGPEVRAGLVSGSTKFPLMLSFRFLCPSAGTLT